MNKLFKSFKLRLFLVMLITSFLILSIIGSIIIDAYYDKSISLKSNETVNELNSFSAFAGAHSFPAYTPDESVISRLNTMSDILGGRILVTNDDFIVVYDSFNEYIGKYYCASEVVKAYSGETVVNETDDLLEILIPLKDVNYQTNNKINGVIYTAVALGYEENIASYLVKKNSLTRLIAMLIMVIVSIACAFILAYPFSKISKQIKDFAAFDDGKIEPSSYVETDDIAEAFNDLKVRLKVLDDSRQEFVSNVSHELKTPITSIKVLADSINEQEDVPNELYREFMQDIVDEIDRENSIITDLLSLVKLDRGVTGLNIEEINVNEMLELIIKRLTPIAESNGIELVLECDVDVYAELDDVKMTLALTNLIENGIKYSNDGSLVRVILTADHSHFTVEIEDSGIGIAKEEIDHIFERFYRVDKSHSREIGGTGLGLAISRKTILLHRGSIKVDSEVNVGTVFTVRIPINYIRA